MNSRTAKEKTARAARRHGRVRAKVTGTTERPRLVVTRSLSNISAQIIDDQKGVTLVAADDRGLTGTKVERAAALGKTIAEKAAAAKVTTVVFDRGSSQYHGRVKAFADAAREAGLQF